MNLEKYSLGVGDRFAHQGKAQLAALLEAKQLGVDIAPVWNKSHREHTTCASQPEDTRRASDAAVRDAAWPDAYFVDADHIGLGNVDLFMDNSDFFTIDVADAIGAPAPADAAKAFIDRHSALIGTLEIPGMAQPIEVTREAAEAIAGKYLLAAQEAGRVYRHIEQAKVNGNFVTEVSMDETDSPQTPVEMLFILAALGDEGVPAQTLAPKFSGRFNKGVDYVGDPAQFATEFEADLAVVAFAIERFGLPADLKLSVHTGSDKFSIYGPINKAIKRFGTGVHVKTAGTTWLEELIGLASAGGEALAIAKEVYASAHGRQEELCAPYASVVDVDSGALPGPVDVARWDGPRFAETVRHDAANPHYNQNVRQLLHVGYKVAAEMGPRYTGALARFEDEIARNVAQNLLERHIKPLFL